MVVHSEGDTWSGRLNGIEANWYPALGVSVMVLDELVELVELVEAWRDVDAAMTKQRLKFQSQVQSKKNNSTQWVTSGVINHSSPSTNPNNRPVNQQFKSKYKS